jgi:hypothetical protein
MVKNPEAAMTKGPASVADIAKNAAWLPHRYDPRHDAIHFLPVTRSVHRRSTFITDEYLPKGMIPTIVARRDAIAVAAAPAPLHFIFHAAFCCSTMLARAFDRPGWAMGLKEPVILNDVIGWRRRGEPGPDMATVLDDVLTLLARPHGPGESVVVKPSNAVHLLAAPMLALRPDARAVLLYAPLRTFLASIAKKGLDGRLWVRVLLLGFTDDKLISLGFTPRDYIGLTDLQVAAVVWLAQQSLFATLVERFGAQRVRTLDSEVLTGRPAEVMAALSALFAMPLPAAEIDDIVAGEAFTRHSKFDTRFAADDRATEHSSAATLHAEEIDKVVIWAAAVARNAGLQMTAPAPLLPAGIT